MSRKLALALAAPLLVATACATEADSGAVAVQTGPAAVATLRAAPAAAADAGSAAFQMRITIRGAEETVDLEATGSFDAEAQQMAMEMDLGDLLGGVTEPGEEGMPGADEPFRFVVDAGTVYIRMPMLDVLTGTSGWLSATPDDLATDGGSLGLPTSAYDPTTFLEVLRGVADDVEVVGDEDVRGVPTTHYKATVRVDRALEQAPAAQREELEARLDELGYGDADLAVDAWVGDDGLIRRLTMDVDELAGGVGLGGDASMQITIELFDYGEPVAIDVPSPDEVTPLTDVLGGLGGGAFGTAGS